MWPSLQNLFEWTSHWKLVCSQWQNDSHQAIISVIITPNVYNSEIVCLNVAVDTNAPLLYVLTQFNYNIPCIGVYYAKQTGQSWFFCADHFQHLSHYSCPKFTNLAVDTTLLTHDQQVQDMQSQPLYNYNSCHTLWACMRNCYSLIIHLNWNCWLSMYIQLHAQPDWEQPLPLYWNHILMKCYAGRNGVG